MSDASVVCSGVIYSIVCDSLVSLLGNIRGAHRAHNSNAIKNEEAVHRRGVTSRQPRLTLGFAEFEANFEASEYLGRESFMVTGAYDPGGPRGARR